MAYLNRKIWVVSISFMMTILRYDFVELFDGPTASSASLGRFCHMGATMVMSTGSSILVRFRSDYSNAGRGFHARYSTGWFGFWGLYL